MSVAVPVLGYEHTGVFYKDTEAAAAWYIRHFGAREVSRSAGAPPIIFLSFGGASLLEMVPAGDQPEAEPSDHAHLSLAVKNLKDAVAGLEEAGISLVKPVFEAYEGSPVAFFRDPEGNLVQLVERVSSLPLPWLG